MSASPTYGELTNQGASTNIAWHQASVDRAARAEQRGHRSAILWFTGLSGSGKSTLAALLLRLYDPDTGRLTVDGQDIRQLDPSWLRRQIGTVSQVRQGFI